jgi:hypothetical protein
MNCRHERLSGLEYRSEALLMRLPQVSVRELFLLVALVAIGLAWWIDRRRTDETHAQLLETIKVVELKQRASADDAAWLSEELERLGYRVLETNHFREIVREEDESWWKKHRGSQRAQFK